MIKRERYLEKIRPFYETDLVKVITGIRRCGKSIILNEIMEEISSYSSNIININFERTSYLNEISDYKTLIDYVNKRKKEGKNYIFLDEVQEIDHWEKAIKELRIDNNSIFITGSNSKHLSKEIMSLLSGRFIEIQIRPFAYKEILEMQKETNYPVSIDDYLIWGGFPARFNLNNQSSTIDYLSELENTIIYNDLIKRYRIKKEVVFKKICNFILQSNSRIISARSIHKVINQECENISLSTILKYIEYLKNAYIISEISKYDTKAKRELSYYYKVYDTDVCFNSLNCQNNRYDIDHNLENIVYNELIYRGYKLKTFVTNNNKEIDFYATKDGKEYYIQVAYSVVDEKAYNREMSAFEGISSNHKKILITTDSLDYSTSNINHIKFKDFLMCDEL